MERGRGASKAVTEHHKRKGVVQLVEQDLSWEGGGDTRSGANDRWRVARQGGAPRGGRGVRAVAKVEVCQRSANSPKSPYRRLVGARGWA